MTHRLFSRNASSSRAIPIQKMVDDIAQDPAMPVFWGANRPGMQATEELAGYELNNAKEAWLDARNQAILHVERMMSNRLHKQIANRVLEPWMHIEVVVSATNWANFYAQRRHPAAQPEMRMLADVMFDVHQASTPTLIKEGDWHLPFITLDERSDLKHPDPLILPKISAARCARVSYLKHDKTKASIEEELTLFDRLVGGDVVHASPTEHQAKLGEPNDICTRKQNFESCWRQFRKYYVPREYIGKHHGHY